MRRLIAIAALFAVTTVQAAGFRSVTLRDFEIDGPAMARAHTAVEITGAYVRNGNVDVIYATPGDAAMAMYGQGGYGQNRPYVALLTDGGSHAVREAMYNCRTYNQVGCLITFRGIVTDCGLANAFGAAHDAPCLEVIDGGAYSSPPPRAPPVSSASTQQGQTSPRAADSDVEPGPAFQKRVRDCVQSPQMQHEADAYRKCEAKELGN